MSAVHYVCFREVFRAAFSTPLYLKVSLSASQGRCSEADGLPVGLESATPSEVCVTSSAEVRTHSGTLPLTEKQAEAPEALPDG